ncbi:alpha-L-fucosidase [Chondrinema litorale]|uniref:alpha-L-fucosidase n=1 Tax=Chondrinema litorale TaxID=2994555 RepID=UPI00254292D9|nr:alpha-L-fucosidase [Chondrinema litorale]UZR97266.1 alpha-L-fucosidase [Chondrinema litorale]
MKVKDLLIVTILISSLTLFSCETEVKDVPPPAPSSVIPTESQVEYQQMEMIGFIHFTVNTFTDKEWGMGDEDISIFNPSELDTEQWVKVAKEAGLKELILTAKHHDGFCLWPSAYTEHSVKNSPYKDGKGDIVKEFTDACKKYGIKAGLYLSPWDRNHADYGKPEYIEYYRNQLTELLTNYGDISEIWFDGANGGDGYYGGANEERRIDKLTYYDWDNTIALVKKLQPNILVFSDAGPDIHWIGNEKGFAGETFWSTIDKSKLVIGGSESAYLNAGDPNGNSWIVGQCDVSIRPGWFYHAKEDDEVKTPEHLLDIYYKSVGRNAILLLNLPPDRRGLLHENDVKNLNTFKQMRDQIFDDNLAKGKEATADTYWGSHPDYAASKITDGSFDTYWAAEQGKKVATLNLDLGAETSFDHLVLQEYTPLGQRVSSFTVYAQDGESWKEITGGTTIGLKRILTFSEVSASKLKLELETTGDVPTIAEWAIYNAE